MEQCGNICCLCIPLKTGGYLIAVLYVIPFIMDFFSNFELQVYISVFFLILYVALASLFVYGIVKMKSGFLIPYMALFTARIASIPALMLLQSVTSFRHLSEDKGKLNWVMFDFVFLALFLLMSAYHWIVVYSLYVFIKAKGIHGKYNLYFCETVKLF